MKAVYCIKNRINGKMYIGQSINISRRFSYHRYFLRNGMHDNTDLQNDWNTFGEDAFDFLVLEEDPEDLCGAEIEWINRLDTFENGYNMTSGGLGTPGAVPWDKGKHRSDSVRAAISRAASKRTGAKNPFFGKRHSAETKNVLRKKRSIPVVDLSTGIIYESAKAADLAFGGRSSNVSKCLNGEALTAYGRKWAYAESTTKLGGGP